jgi:hypothetical protein
VGGGGIPFVPANYSCLLHVCVPHEKALTDTNNVFSLKGDIAMKNPARFLL